MKIKTLALSAAALISSIILPATAAAQNATTSPYSMMGYGLLNDHVTSAQRAMGGVGYAMRSASQINVMNPASYAAIDSMTFLFDMGVDAGALHSTESGESNKKTLGGLNYITMQVPLTKWMGASLGLLPYSTVGYDFGGEVVNGESTYQGSGGINEAYIGVGAKPFKNFTVGANVGYLFGNIINDTYVLADNSLNSSSLYERVLKVRDYNLQFGAQYGVNIGRKNQVTVGVTYSPGKSTLGHCYGVKYDVENGSTAPDTIGYTSTRHGYSRPDSWGAGLAYNWNNSLLVEADVTYQPWSKARFDGIEGFSNALQLADRYKVAFGAAYTPHYRGSYLRRMTYRVGAFYNRDYMMIGTNNVKEIGITCGLGLPTPMRTLVNVGFEYRHRATSPVATLSENYYMVTLGISLNETWFMPSKIR
jgi:hypothetical protein